MYYNIKFVKMYCKNFQFYLKTQSIIKKVISVTYTLNICNYYQKKTP